MVNEPTTKEVEFIDYLKKIQIESRKIDPILVTCSSNFMCTRMNHVFNILIQVHSMTDQEISRLFMLMKKSNIDYRIQAIVMANLLEELDKSKNNSLHQTVIKRHMFGINW